jgi:hypothetical protein
MTENVENLVLEHLRHIRGRVDQIADDVTDLRHRMTSLENAMALVKREVAYSDEADARQQVSIDNPTARVERIERRLELQD